MSTKSIVARMLENSNNAPTTPSRRGVVGKVDPILEEAIERYPTDGEFLLTKELSICTPSGGQFFLSRTKPLPPKSEGCERSDRRLSENRKGRDPAITTRMLLYGMMADAGYEIMFIPLPEHLQNRQVVGKALESLAEAIGRGVSDE
jgi:hypothetical protein